MNLAKFPIVFEPHVRALAKRLQRLDKLQNRKRRNNARRAVLTQLSRIRAALDREFPVVSKEIKKERVYRSLSQWRERMRKRGYEMVHSSMQLSAILLGGVKTVRIPKRIAGSNPAYHYAPEWAVLATLHKMKNGNEFNSSKVRELKKSVSARKAFLAAHRLGAFLKPNSP